MNNKPIKTKAATVEVNTLKTSARRAHIANMLMMGGTKKDVVEWLQTNFPKMEPKQVQSEYRSGLTYLYMYSEQTKDEIRNMNLARLENLIDRIEQDEQLSSRHRYNALIKTIDVESKVAGLYAPEVQQTVNIGDEYVVELGTMSTEQTQQAEIIESDEEDEDDE